MAKKVQNKVNVLKKILYILFKKNYKFYKNPSNLS